MLTFVIKTKDCCHIKFFSMKKNGNIWCNIFPLRIERGSILYIILYIISDL